MRLIKQIIVTTILTTLGFTTLSGCNIRDVDTTESFSYGVISTTAQKSSTNIIAIDSDFNVLSTTNYKLGEIGGMHYHRPVVVNNCMYDISLEGGRHGEGCKVIELNLLTNHLSEYKFYRDMITNLSVTGQYIYTISNLNGTTYIDRYSFANKNIDTIELEGVIAMDMCVYRDIVYAIGEKDDKFIMYKVDITNKIIDMVSDLTDEFGEDDIPSYQIIYNDKLYLPRDNQLLEISLDDYNIKAIELPYNESFALQLKDNLLYITFLDKFDQNAKTNIVAYDLESKEVMKQYELDCNVMQFIIDNDEIIVLSLDDILYHYSMISEKKCALIAKTELTPEENYYLSALFGKDE